MVFLFEESCEKSPGLSLMFSLHMTWNMKLWKQSALGSWLKHAIGYRYPPQERGASSGGSSYSSSDRGYGPPMDRGYGASDRYGADDRGYWSDRGYRRRHRDHGHYHYHYHYYYYYYDVESHEINLLFHIISSFPPLSTTSVMIPWRTETVQLIY